MIFGGWAAIVVEDDMDVTNTALTPDPETELKLSELSFPADIDEHIRVLSGSTGLVSAEPVYERDSETRDVIITPAEMEDDLHILMLDEDSGAVESVVHFVGGWHDMTGVMVTAIDLDSGDTGEFDPDTSTKEIAGGGDDDVVIGGEARDNVTGGSTSHDLLIGGDGDDSLKGNAGDDTLFGMDGEDTLKGDADEDEIYGGEGDDTLEGGTEDDTLSGGPGADDIDGGGDTDLLLEVANIHAVLETDGSHDGTFGHVVDGFGFQLDTLTSIEEAFISGGDDDNSFDASDFTGKTTLIGFGGDDTLLGGEDENLLDGGGGDDLIEGGAED